MVVGDAVGDLDRTDIGHRYAQILCLAAAIAAKHVAEAEQPGGRMAHRLGGHLGIGVGPVAGREQAFAAEPTVAAADRERHHDAVADLEVGDLGPERYHLAHVLVAEDVARLHGGLVPVEQVEVRPADRARRHLDDRVAWMLDLGVRDSVDADVALTVPAQRAHVSSPAEEGLRRDRKSN